MLRRPVIYRPSFDERQGQWRLVRLPLLEAPMLLPTSCCLMIIGSLTLLSEYTPWQEESLQEPQSRPELGDNLNPPSPKS